MELTPVHLEILKTIESSPMKFAGDDFATLEEAMISALFAEGFVAGDKGKAVPHHLGGHKTVISFIQLTEKGRSALEELSVAQR